MTDLSQSECWRIEVDRVPSGRWRYSIVAPNGAMAGYSAYDYETAEEAHLHGQELFDVSYEPAWGRNV